MANYGTQDQAIPNVTTLYRSTAAVTLVNSTTETSIIGSSGDASDSLVLPANYLTVGKHLRIILRGTYSTPALNTATLTFRIKLGSTTLVTGVCNALALAPSVQQGVSIQLNMTCWTTGSTGTVMPMGSISYATGVNTSPINVAINSGATTPITIDTTSQQTVGFTGQWSVANASNTFTESIFVLESLN